MGYRPTGVLEEGTTAFCRCGQLTCCRKIPRNEILTYLEPDCRLFITENGCYPDNNDHIVIQGDGYVIVRCCKNV